MIYDLNIENVNHKMLTMNIIRICRLNRNESLMYMIQFCLFLEKRIIKFQI